MTKSIKTVNIRTQLVLLFLSNHQPYRLPYFNYSFLFPCALEDIVLFYNLFILFIRNYSQLEPYANSPKLKYRQSTHSLIFFNKNSFVIATVQAFPPNGFCFKFGTRMSFFLLKHKLFF